MKPSTARTVRAISSFVPVILAILLLIYAAGAKLATIESAIGDVVRRLTRIEGILLDGRSPSEVAGRGRSIEGHQGVGRSAPVLGLLSAGAGDNPGGAVVLHGNRQDPE